MTPFLGHAETAAPVHVMVMCFDAEDDPAEERYWQCVKDLNGTTHVGGYPARAIVIETVKGYFVLYKADLRPDTAINLARSIARNESRKWYRIHCVNQKLKTRVDTIYHSGWQRDIGTPSTLPDHSGLPLKGNNYE